MWGYEHDPGTNVVGVYVGYLRRKLALPGSPAPIETVRSAGYRLRIPNSKFSWDLLFKVSNLTNNTDEYYVGAWHRFTILPGRQWSGAAHQARELGDALHRRSLRNARECGFAVKHTDCPDHEPPFPIDADDRRPRTDDRW